ncbi:MAG TPA: PilZ domain-containing protein [Acidobacteriota bacterium]|nr:PilZ domain-containing protein [Acidobacteriota bacterium]
MAEYKDKRRSVRVPVEFSVQFTFDNKEHLAEALNLSVDGMFLKTTYMLLQGDIIEIFFHLPNAEEPLWMKAQVMWGTWIEGMNLPTSGMGVRFVDPLPEQRDHLENYIRELIES